MIPFLPLVYEWIWKYAMPSITGSVCHCRPLLLTVRGGWWKMAAKSRVNQRGKHYSIFCGLIGWRRKEPWTMNSMVYSVGHTYSCGVDEIPASSQLDGTGDRKYPTHSPCSESTFFRQIWWQPGTVFSANISLRVCKCFISMHSESHSFRWRILPKSSNTN